MRTRLLALVVFASVILPLCVRAQNTASGVINASLMNKSGISLLFSSDPGGVALSGASTNSASLDFGHVAMFMSSPPTGVTLTRTAQDFTVTSRFDTYVDIAGMTSTGYSLSASLLNAPGVFAYSVDGKTLSSTGVVQISNSSLYKQDVPHTISITVPASAPAGTVNNTINFVATAN